MKTEPSTSHHSTTDCGGSDSIGYLVHTVSRLLFRSVDRELRPLNISAAQLAPLLALSEHGSMLQRDLVKLSAVGQPAMVAALTKLERDSLIARRADPKDGRASIVCLTSQGHALVEAALPTLSNINQKALNALSTEEVKALTSSLRRLSIALNEDEATE